MMLFLLLLQFLLFLLVFERECFGRTEMSRDVVGQRDYFSDCWTMTGVTFTTQLEQSRQ